MPAMGLAKMIIPAATAHIRGMNLRKTTFIRSLSVCLSSSPALTLTSILKTATIPVGMAQKRGMNELQAENADKPRAPT